MDTGNANSENKSSTGGVSKSVVRERNFKAAFRGKAAPRNVRFLVVLGLANKRLSDKAHISRYIKIILQNAKMSSHVHLGLVAVALPTEQNPILSVENNERQKPSVE